ncbi:MAG: hypothetical protein HQL28_03780, partial [Candidatus Omnitrophica bacterium]|nr:hypothetical protein [Candidatus Omnitrophota bacterium]
MNIKAILRIARTIKDKKCVDEIVLMLHEKILKEHPMLLNLCLGTFGSISSLTTNVQIRAGADVILRRFLAEKNKEIRASAFDGLVDLVASGTDETQKAELIKTIFDNIKLRDDRFEEAHLFAGLITLAQSSVDKNKYMPSVIALFKKILSSDQSKLSLRLRAFKAMPRLLPEINDEPLKAEFINIIFRLDRDTYLEPGNTKELLEIAEFIMPDSGAAMEKVFDARHQEFTEVTGTNVRQLKKSDYDIIIDKVGNAIVGTFKGEELVRQPISGTCDETLLKGKGGDMILDPETKKQLIDLMFFSSQKKLTPVFLMGPTATGKTSKVRFLAKLAGKNFLRVQFNAQTDELDLMGHFIPKGLSISYPEAACAVQEELARGSMARLQYILSLLMPTDEMKARVRVDASFARRQLESALTVKKDAEDLV